MTETIRIRKATIEDRSFIADLMEETLNPVYDEDHRKKAHLLLESQLDNSEEKFGLLSSSQTIFVITADLVPVGMANLVTKRQRTIKISPIIVSTKYRNKGIGTQFYDYLEEYARENGARQLFCTVSEDRARMLAFFQKKHFIIAAKCSDYYKKDVAEFLLYKDLSIGKQWPIDNYDVVLLETLAMDVQRLALDKFFGDLIAVSDHKLVEKISRQSLEGRSKVYISIKKNDDIAGMAVLTKKKNGNVKILPIYYRDFNAFRALVHYLSSSFTYPRVSKIYLNTFGGGDEVVFLQQQGWRLEGLLPNAYKENTLTVLWSLDPT